MEAPILKSVEELKQAWDRACLYTFLGQWNEIHCRIPPRLASDPEVKRILEEIKAKSPESTVEAIDGYPG